MSLLKLRYTKQPGYTGNYVVRIYTGGTLEREVTLTAPLPDDIVASIVTNLETDYVYEVYAMACGTTGTLVGKGVAKFTAPCAAPTVNFSTYENGSLRVFFSNSLTPPVNGYRLTYRVQGSAGAFLNAGSFQVSPAIVPNVLPGVVYEWQLQGDCGGNVYSLPVVGTINT